MIFLAFGWDLVSKFCSYEMIRFLDFQETAEDLYPAAAKNVIHHLEKLVKEGKVHRDENLFWTS